MNEQQAQQIQQQEAPAAEAQDMSIDDFIKNMPATKVEQKETTDKSSDATQEVDSAEDAVVKFLSDKEEESSSKDDDIAKIYKNIERKKNDVLKKEQEIRLQEEKFKKLQEELNERSKKIELSQRDLDDLRDDPIGFFERKNLGPEQLEIIARSMREGKKSSIPRQEEHKKPEQGKTDEETKALREKVDFIQQELMQARRESALTSIKDFIDKNVDTYDLICNANRHEDVLNLIASSYQQGRELSVKEACDQLEMALENNLKGMLNSKKIRAKFGATNIAPKKTMASSMTPAPAAFGEEDDGLSIDEARERFISSLSR